MGIKRGIEAAGARVTEELLSTANEVETQEETAATAGFERGVAVNTLPSATQSLTDEEFEPFFEELNRREAVLYIHPTGTLRFPSRCWSTI